MSLLETKKLAKYYQKRKSPGSDKKFKVMAVDRVSLTIEKGEILGLVGESGCGKSTLGRLVTRLEDKTSGEIYFEGQEISCLGGKKLRSMRRHFQIIFQDSTSSLNPRWQTRTIIEEPLLNYGLSKNERSEKCSELLGLVGLEKEDGLKFPHQFSGGQRQRINIARALALEPTLLVCDEPVSSLDVSIRAQILKLLQTLQQELNLTYLFISHDLAAVSSIASRVAVMYLGQIVEILPAADLKKIGIHPYTQALVGAIPEPDPAVAKELFKSVIKGEPPDSLDPPRGCRFHPRCPHMMSKCREENPVLEKISGKHYSACHLLH